MLEYVYAALLLAGGGALIFAGIWAGAWLRERAKTSQLARLGERLWGVGSAMAAHVRAGLQPTVVAALADGRITPQEWKRIREETLRLVKEALGAKGLEEVRRAFGIGGTAIDSMLSGVVERVLASQLPALPAPSSASTIPPGISVPRVGLTVPQGP
jgi:hypothetical protein